MVSFHIYPNNLQYKPFARWHNQDKIEYFAVGNELCVLCDLCERNIISVFTYH